MRELHLFAGVGGGILGGMLLGHTCVCAVEVVEYRWRVLLQRQRDGVFERFPIWGDVRTFDGGPWRGRVDVVCGGFPCQDISTAGKGAGINGAKSGLWKEMARIVGEVRPRYVFVENAPALTLRGLDRVLGDLAALGYDAEWGIVSAADAIWLDGPPAVYHERQRIWVLAGSNLPRERNRCLPEGSRHQRKRVGNADWLCASRSDTASIGRDKGSHNEQRLGSVSNQKRQGQPKRVCGGDESTYADGERLDKVEQSDSRKQATEETIGQARKCGFAERHHGWWQAEPGLGRVADGVADRAKRIAAIGDGQVPRVAALAWRILWERLHAH